MLLYPAVGKRVAARQRRGIADSLFSAENSKQRLEKRMKVCYDDVNTLICESETNFQKGTVKSWQDLLIQIGLKWKHC